MTSASGSNLLTIRLVNFKNIEQYNSTPVIEVTAGTFALVHGLEDRYMPSFQINGAKTTARKIANQLVNSLENARPGAFKR